MSSGLNVYQKTELYGKVIVETPFRSYGGFYYNITVGAFSYIANSSNLSGVTIGRYCSIGDNVHILSQHPTDTFSTSPVFYEDVFDAPFRANQRSDFKNIVHTTIGNDVWVGSGVKIKTGLTIGDGAVIGAGSVVTKDVAPFSIVGGVPAKLIKMRFSPEIIERLQKLAWWQYNLLPYQLSWNDLESTLTQLENMNDLVPYVGKRYQIWNENGEIKGKAVGVV
jgi:acetyltransferase-like isoleucine patch superfamily enzyme